MAFKQRKDSTQSSEFEILEHSSKHSIWINQKDESRAISSKKLFKSSEFENI